MSITWARSTAHFLSAFTVTIGWALACGQAEAACHETYGFEDVVREWTYEINTTSFGQLSGITSMTGPRAVVSAADTWNEQANSSYFRYTGTTTRDSIDDQLTSLQCDAQNIKSLVVVDPARFQGSANNAETQTNACLDANGIPTRFVIYINVRDFGVGDVSGTNKLDLESIIAHEFGHVVGLGHPAQGGEEDEATMQLTDDGAGRMRRRDLYQWDIECANGYSPGYPQHQRSLTGYEQFQVGSYVYSQTAFTGAWNVAKATASMTHHNGYWQWSSAVKREDWLYWTEDLDTADTMPVSASYLTAAFTSGLWREDLSMDRGFSSEYLDYPDSYDLLGKHRVYYYRSSNGFQSDSSSPLYHCNSMTGWMTCSSMSNVFSSEPVAVAWVPQYSRSVVAWVNQNRLDNAESWEIFVSIGTLQHWLLSEPDKLGVRSSVSPGVACASASSPLGATCVVAYVSVSDPYQRVKLRKYIPIPWGDRYQLFFISETTTSLATGSRIAAWFADGKFWFAARSMDVGQAVAAYNSTDGVQWTLVDSDIGPSVTGPSAVSYYNDSTFNVLVTAH